MTPLNAALALWQDKAAGRAIPARADMTARAMKPFLTQMSLLEQVTVDGVPRYRVRLHGSALARYSGDSTGKFLEDVVHADRVDSYRALYDEATTGLPLLTPVLGGETRQASVHNGLESLTGSPPDLVLIHDAARPFIDAPTIDRTATTTVVNTSPTLTVPGAQSQNYHDSLTFGISASDPDAGDTVSLSASGLPAGLNFTDNGNRTGAVSGTITAPPGVYTATFKADDHHHLTLVTDTVQITVTKEETATTYTGPTGTQAALQALTWTRVLRGLAVDDLCDRFEQASDEAWYLAPAPHRVAAQRLVWRFGPTTNSINVMPS